MRLGAKLLIGATLLALALSIVPGARADIDPLAVPTGRLVVTLPVDGVRQLFTVEADGSDRVQLTSGPDIAYNPAWSPGGSRIAFARSGAIWTVPATGGEPTQVVAPPADGGSYGPSWSPDGSSIAFVRYGGAPSYTSDIYIVNADGSGLRELRPGSIEREWAPKWSPSGFVGFNARRRHSEIWLADPSGQSSAPLVRRAGDEHAGGLSWRPDGRLSYEIVTYRQGGEYGSQTFEERATWTADAGGTRPTPWLLGPADAGGSWSPDSKCFAYSYGRDSTIDDESNPPAPRVRIHCGGLEAEIDDAQEPDWKPGPPPVTDSSIVQRVVAGGNGITTWSGLLVPGDRYEIVARGTYSYGLADGLADAECSNGASADPVFVAPRFAWQDIGGDPLDLYVGGHQHDDWIPDSPDGAGCSLTHVYRLPFTAASADPISFQVRDVETSDNYGALTIELRRLG